MKQFLAKSNCGNHFAVALKSLALLYINGIPKSNNDNVYHQLELKESSSSVGTAPDIHAIAISTILGTLYCAVARSDKSLDLYSVKMDEEEKGSNGELKPDRTIRTGKRLSSMEFMFLSEAAKDKLSGWCLICADYAGDVTAYPFVDHKSKDKDEVVSRLLLGHT